MNHPLAATLVVFATAVSSYATFASAAPNIVLIYADDVGFGDVSCNGAKAVATPNIDRLATEGIRFTDAHSSAATCTPSRYAMLTGSYAFRKKGTGIRAGDSNLIIRPGTTTLQGRLQSVGYATGVVGKWRLGLGDGRIDWNKPIAPGPNEIGFGYHFLIPATGDRVPCVYVEQGRVVDHDPADPADPIRVSYGKPIDNAPTGKQRPDLLKQRWSHGHNGTIVNGISRIGQMTGGTRARWVDEDMADVINAKAVRFLEANQKKPFILYFSTHDIHVPRVPHSRFVGATDMGLRGDAIVQLDWCVGQVLSALDRLNLTEQTLVLFTSDNGPVLDDGYQDESVERIGDHRPAGDYRAGKYSRFEGGTRVPLVARWPGSIKPGAVSGALVGQIDFAASLSLFAGAEVGSETFLDSQDQRSALLGEDQRGHSHLVLEASRLALRQGEWKYLSPPRTRDGLGPWTEAEFGEVGALYNLADDPGEQVDLASAEAKRLENMRALLEQVRSGPKAQAAN